MAAPARDSLHRVGAALDAWLPSAWGPATLAWAAALLLTISAAAGLIVVRRRRAIDRWRTQIAFERGQAGLDAMLQGVQGLMFQVEAVRALLPTQPRRAALALERTLEAGDAMLGRALAASRRDAAAPRDPVVGLGLLAEALAGRWGAGTHVQLWARGCPRPVPDAVYDRLLTAGRESLTNALRHAHARHVDVELVYRRRSMTLCVRDDGDGIRKAVSAGAAGGLATVCAGCAEMGGRVEIRSGPQAGTEFTLALPLRCPRRSPAAAAAPNIAR